MAILKLQVEYDRADDLQFSGTGRHYVLNRLSAFLQAVNAGAYPASAVLRETGAVKASGTFTLATVIATDAVSINGVTFTAVASGATGDQFNVGASDALTAANLAAAINASATELVSEHVTASAADEVVTVTAKFAGHAGNAITIASADATITASGARLEGGDGTQTSLSL